MRPNEKPQSRQILKSNQPKRHKIPEFDHNFFCERNIFKPCKMSIADVQTAHETMKKELIAFKL